MLFENTPFAYVMPILSGYCLIGAVIGLTIIYGMKAKPEEVEKVKQQIWDSPVDDEDDEEDKAQRIALLENRAVVFLMFVLLWPFVLIADKLVKK